MWPFISLEQLRFLVCLEHSSFLALCRQFGIMDSTAEWFNTSRAILNSYLGQYLIAPGANITYVEGKEVNLLNTEFLYLTKYLHRPWIPFLARGYSWIFYRNSLNTKSGNYNSIHFRSPLRNPVPVFTIRQLCAHTHRHTQLIHFKFLLWIAL